VPVMCCEQHSTMVSVPRKDTAQYRKSTVFKK
jgi:hypothetical protein